MKNKTRIERLNATLYLAECVPAGLLDQGNWTQHNCKTTHCIAGWCGVSKWHNRRGYRLGRVPTYMVPMYRGAYVEAAFADFHGISIAEALQLTIDNVTLKGESARRDVTTKLKDLIRKYGGEVINDTPR